MTIRKDGSKFKIDVNFQGRRKRASASTQEEAELKEKAILESLMYGVSSEVNQYLEYSKKVWTLKEAFDCTCKNVWDHSKDSVQLSRNAEEALKFFGPSKPINEITTEALDSFVDHLKSRGRSDSTINRKLAGVSKMMTEAQRRGRLDHKPFIPRRKESQGRIRYITPEEETQMLTLLTQWSMTDMIDCVIVLVDTGVRTGELRAIEERDVDWRTNRISIWENKTDHPRSIPMTERVQEVIRRRMKLHRGRLFPFKAGWLRYPWDRLKGNMGLATDDQFVPHCLRHTCASRLAQRGVALQVIQSWMGHKAIQITLRYAHLAPSNLDSALAVLEFNKPQLKAVI